MILSGGCIKGIILQGRYLPSGLPVICQSLLRRKGDVTGASVHAPIHKNSTYVHTVRQSIYETRRPEHPHSPIRSYGRLPQGPSSRPHYKLPSLTSTQLLLLDEVHVKQVSGPPTKSQVNDYNVLFPRGEEGKVYVVRGVYDTNNKLKKAAFKYEQEGRFFIGVSRV